jgi:hypothetical protein
MVPSSIDVLALVFGFFNALRLIFLISRKSSPRWCAKS